MLRVSRLKDFGFSVGKLSCFPVLSKSGKSNQLENPKFQHLNFISSEAFGSIMVKFDLCLIDSCQSENI